MVVEHKELLFMNSLNGSDQEEMDEPDSRLLFQENNDVEMSKQPSR